MRDTEHYIELMLLYDTTDGEELIKAMKEDIKAISKELKCGSKEDEYSGLDYARIGADNWK